MSDINPSSIKVTPALAEKLKTLVNVDDIKEAMKEAAIEQNLVHRDWDDSILVPNEPGTAPKGFAKSIVLNGVKTIIEGSTEQELLANENAFMRAAFANPGEKVQQTEQVRGAEAGKRDYAAAAAVSEEKKAELALQLQLGQIDVATYLEHSGAVGDYLENQGVDLESLKEVAASKQDDRFQQSWTSATEEFCTVQQAQIGRVATRILQ